MWTTHIDTVAHLDVMDVAGDQTLDHFQYLVKQRVDLKGKLLGPAAINDTPAPVQFTNDNALNALLQVLLLSDCVTKSACAYVCCELCVCVCVCVMRG